MRPLTVPHTLPLFKKKELSHSPECKTIHLTPSLTFAPYKHIEPYVTRLCEVVATP